MCFRPADADVAGPRACPHCGKMVFPADGILPKKCPFCRDELDAGMSAPVAPAMPDIPTAPTVPGAPSVSSVPDAPSTSTAPSALGVSGASRATEVANSSASNGLREDA